MLRCKKCNGTGMVEKSKKTGRSIKAKVRRWCKLEPFAASTKQISRYLSWRGILIPRNKKEDRDTADQSSLERLAKKYKDPLFPLILKYRTIEKIKETQMDGWSPGSDGCIHPKFSFNNPTGELESRSPNIQAERVGDGNVGLRARLANRFRSMIKPKMGRCLVEFRYKNMMLAMLSLESQDSELMRLTLEDNFENIHIKRAILNSYLSAKHLLVENPDIAGSIKEAQVLLDQVKEKFPKLAKWQEEIKHLAQWQHILKSRFGYVMWFWDVLWKGEQAEQAMAFLPKNDAFGLVNSVIVELESLGLNKKYKLCLVDYDKSNGEIKLLFHCYEGMQNNCISDVSKIMKEQCLKLSDSVVAPKGLELEIQTKIIRRIARDLFISSSTMA